MLLEIFLSKREILQLYLNRVYLSGGIYGVETMSQKMFGKPASESDARRSRADRRHHPRAGAVLAVDPLRRRAPAQLRRAAADARGREDHRGAGAGGARRDASASTSHRRCRAPGTATRRNTCGSSSATSTAATTRPTGRCTRPSCPSAGCRRSRRARRAAPPGRHRACRRRSSRSTRQTGNILAMVGGSDFAGRRRSIARCAAGGSRARPSSRSSTPRRSRADCRRCRRIQGLQRSRSRRRKASGFRATSARARRTR